MSITTEELKNKAIDNDVRFHMEKVGSIVVGCSAVQKSDGKFSVSYEINGQRANKKLVDMMIAKEAG